jgi:hypothetical protein
MVAVETHNFTFLEPQLFLFFTMSFLLKGVQDGVNRMLFGQDAKTTKTAFYELVDRLILSKDETPMSTYKGEVVMVVNVASK